MEIPFWKKKSTFIVKRNFIGSIDERKKYKTIPEDDFQICRVCTDKDGSQSVNQSKQWY